MADTLMIEPMVEGDLEAVAAIEEASFKDPWSLQSFRAELRYNRLALYLVAHSGGKVVGYIGAWSILDEAHITTLAVEPSFRRHGVATRMFQALSEAVCEGGAETITLEVRPSNTSARNFYERCGFTVQGRRLLYYRDEDALIMTRFETPSGQPRGEAAGRSGKAGGRGEDENESV